MKTGDRVEFLKYQWKCICNGEIDIANHTGTITELSPDMFCVRLDTHYADLDEWDNEVIWTTDDILWQVGKDKVVSDDYPRAWMHGAFHTLASEKCQLLKEAPTVGHACVAGFANGGFVDDDAGAGDHCWTCPFGDRILMTVAQYDKERSVNMFPTQPGLPITVTITFDGNVEAVREFEDLSKAELWIESIDTQALMMSLYILADDIVKRCARLALAHDFCDANMTFGAAFEQVMGRESVASDEGDAAIWNTATDLADDVCVQRAKDGLDDLVECAFNLAVKVIQDGLGVKTGDFAGSYFSEYDAEEIVCNGLKGYAVAELDRLNVLEDELEDRVKKISRMKPRMDGSRKPRPHHTDHR